jgi:hypothetical protein
MPRDVTGKVADDYYDPKFFGSDFVVDLPSTVHGQLWDRMQVDRLLANGQVIGIEEHIASIRPDGLIQTPNVIDDIVELRRLYRYLRSKNVWHANCSDIAAYVVARERSFLYGQTLEGFSIRYEGRIKAPPISLRIDASAICSVEKPRIRVTLPSGETVARDAYRFDEDVYHHLVTVPAMSGDYEVHACAEPAAGI